jgi:HEAT repeat protein
VRSSAVSSLGRLKASGAVAALCDLIRGGEDASLCKAATEALGKIGDPAALPTLQEAAKAFPAVVVRSTCDMAARNLLRLQRTAQNGQP